MIGGFKNKVSDIDFKYTTDPSRIFWVKTFYPHLGTLVSAIQRIDYNSYEYTGNFIFKLEILERDNSNEENPYDYLYKVEHIHLDRDSLSYYFFGGICYELLNDFNKTPPLSNYVDPTGDIDIAIMVPEITPSKKLISEWNKINKYDGYNVNTLFFDESINPYYLDIAKWIHSNLLSIVEELNINIRESIEFDISEYQIENKLEMIDVVVRNAHVILYIEGSHTIKVQLIYKIRNSEGLEVIDHLVEFLVTPPIYNNSSHQSIIIKDIRLYSVAGVVTCLFH